MAHQDEWGWVIMARFRCPECDTESDVAPKNGYEVVALYCLRHTGGADGHTRPVSMMCVEPVAATGLRLRAERCVAAGGRRNRTRSRTERCAADEAETAAVTR
jgi:hypothetical protein